MIFKTFLYALLLSFCSSVASESLSTSPPMGWNSWNWWGKTAINEKLIRDTIDAMEQKGLREAGYNYIVVDGGWRDNKLDGDGYLLVHKGRFPSGMKALADYAHAKGFKFGLHTVPGTHDCGGDKVGSWNIEEKHVKQFSEWGIDFVKLDQCSFFLNGEKPKGPNSFEQRQEGWLLNNNLEEAYTRWHDLIKQSGRAMLLSASAYYFYDWYPKITQMGRTTFDIGCKYCGGARFDEKPPKHFSVMYIAEDNNKYAKYAGNGYWNDPDMLVTGDEQGLTHEQQKAHFALWSIMSSPLMLGSDPISMPQQELDIVANKTAIEINQDPSEQGTRIFQHDKTEIWAKNLSDGRVAVLMLNRHKQKAQDITVSFSQLGLTKKSQKVYDVYSEKSLGKSKQLFSQEIASGTGLFLLIGE